MDRKGIALIAVCLAGMLGLKYVADLLWPTPKGARSEPPALSVSNAPSARVNAPPAATTHAAPALAGGPVVPPSLGAAEESVVLENDLLRITFTSHGGGARLIELKKYPASVDCSDAAAKGIPSALNRFAPLPALTLGAGPLTGDGIFGLRKSGSTVRAEKILTNGLGVSQEWSLSNGYFFETVVTLENRGASPISVPPHEYVVGAATPMDRHDPAEVQGAYWFDGTKAEQIHRAWFANATMGCSTISTPRTEFSGGSSNVVWAAVHNQFFALIAQPDRSPAGVRVLDLPLPKPSPAERNADGRLNADPHAYHTSFTYGAETLKPGEKRVRRHTIYAGPKEYRQLKTSEKQLDLVMDFTGITGFCAKALLLLLNAVHSLIPSYGASIVVLTILIKLAFWPLTNASTRSMKRMSTLQPQMNAIREKYKNDPAKMNQKTMEFMKEHRINPMAGCLPLLLTFPVFIGFFFMLRTAIELRGESFLWCCDLSRPDSVYVVPGLGFIPLLGISGIGLPLNIMPLLYLATAWWQSTLTPVSPQMDPAQQKMLKYMPVFFGVLFYNYSAGLTLYWTTQNLMTILQTKITKANEGTGTGGSAVVVSPVQPGRRKGSA
ncbi:MAG: membrane protein insertase YidC [Verrucomicrobiota bacterium]